MATSTHRPTVRLEACGPKTFAGLLERYEPEARSGIPEQWQRFIPRQHELSAAEPHVTYGVCVMVKDQPDSDMDYLTGVEASPTSQLPEGMTTVTLAPSHYVVVEHPGPIHLISESWAFVFSDWLPKSGYQKKAAGDFERYGPAFDGESGDVEIWISIEA